MNSIPTEIKTIQSHYDYQTAWKYVFVKGIEIYGPRFQLYQEDVQVIIKLLSYFLQDAKLSEQLGIELHKGIMLTGPVGCGKTSLMNLMRYLLPPQYRHSIKPTREIAIAYAEEGYHIIQLYTKRCYNSFTHEPLTICFDDLGLEVPVQYFGNHCNTMAEILLGRYDHHGSSNMLTHLTTNLSALEIEQRYGIRVRSRCRELFNLIPFDNSAIDKRR